MTTCLPYNTVQTAHKGDVRTSSLSQSTVAFWFRLFIHYKYIHHASAMIMVTSTEAASTDTAHAEQSWLDLASKTAIPTMPTEQALPVLHEHLLTSLPPTFNSFYYKRAVTMYSRYQAIPEKERLAWQKLTIKTYERASRKILSPLKDATAKSQRSYYRRLAEAQPNVLADAADRLDFYDKWDRDQVLDFKVTSTVESVDEDTLTGTTMDTGEEEPQEVEYFYLDTTVGSKYLPTTSQGNLSKRVKIGWYHQHANPRVNIIQPSLTDMTM